MGFIGDFGFRNSAMETIYNRYQFCEQWSAHHYSTVFKIFCNLPNRPCSIVYNATQVSVNLHVRWILKKEENQMSTKACETPPPLSCARLRTNPVTKGPSEKRSRSRLLFRADAEVTIPGGSEIRGRLRDISITSLFLETDAILPRGLTCGTLICIQGKNSKLHLSINGHVVRYDHKGIAIRFNEDLEWWTLFSIFSHHRKGA